MSLADALTARGFFCAGRGHDVLVFDDEDAAAVSDFFGFRPTWLAPSVSAFAIRSMSNDETSVLVNRILSVPSP